MTTDCDKKTAVELLNLGADVVQFLCPRKLTIDETRTVLRHAEALLDTVPLPAPEEPEPETDRVAIAEETARAEAAYNRQMRQITVAHICMMAATLCTLAVTLYRLFAR